MVEKMVNAMIKGRIGLLAKKNKLKFITTRKT